MGLEIIRRTRSSIAQMPVTNFFLSCIFTNEQAVGFIQTGICMAQTDHCVLPAIQVIEMLYVRCSVSVKLNVVHQSLALCKPSHSERKRLSYCKTCHNTARLRSCMAKPTPQEIDDFYKKWWLENYMTPLNRTPMGLVQFISDFYERFCIPFEEEVKPGLTD